MGNFFNHYYNKIFNTPKNFDHISSKKTTLYLYLLCFLGLVCWLVFIVVIVKDSSNRLTFSSQRIENDVTTPEISYYTTGNISSFSINNVGPEIAPVNINFTNGFNCNLNKNISNFECNKVEIPPNIAWSVGKDNFKIKITKYNVTFQQNYLNIDVSTFLKNQSVTTLENIPIFMFVIKFHNLVFSLNGPANVQILFKKQINVDRHGNETVTFVPNPVSSGKQSYMCLGYDQYVLYPNCSSNSLSIIYETNIVTIYTEETDGELILRILKDLFSIGKLLVTVIGLVVTFIQTRFLFPQQTAIFENTIRDAVLFHFNYHEMEPYTEKPGLISKCFGGLKYIFCCFCCRKPNTVKTVKKISKEKKLKLETEGSSWRIVRLFQGLPTMDKYSSGLSSIFLVKTCLLIAVMIVYTIFIGYNDVQNRLVITTKDFQEFVEIPNIVFEYTGILNAVWSEYLETLPNGDIKDCNFTLGVPQKIGTCSYSGSDENGVYNQNSFPSDTLQMSYNQFSTFSTISLVNGSVLLKEGELYSFSVANFLFINSSFPTLDTLQLSLSINDITYFLVPFSNISVVIEKTVYHYQNGSTILSYNPRIFQSMYQPILFGTVDDILIYKSQTDIQFGYSTTYINNIYTESEKELALRVLSDIGAFYSPLNLLLGLFFTYTIVRFVYKYDTAHIDPSIREPIIYHLKYYDKYSKIYTGTSKQ